MADTDPGFGVYVHWPFCAAKCPYCDFNSHVRAAVDQSVWAEALCAELRDMAARTDRQRLRSVFFGGGTPSLMEPATVGAVLETVHDLWSADSPVEITLEANPTSVEAGRFAGYAAAGVNRVSLGVQALNDPDLKALGRMHTASEAIAAFEVARAQFDRVSFDLIYARQGQTLRDWTSELGQALKMTVDHLSLYQLTIEPGTAFGTRHAHGGLTGLPSDDLSADLYDATQEVCVAAGVPAYEISNHARRGAESQHNLIYWRGGLYAGIGPGAHGRVARNGKVLATQTTLSPEVWLSKVQHTPGSATTWEAVPDPERATEYMMMALRLREGADVSHYATLSGTQIPQDTIDGLVGDGFLTRNGSIIAATQRGRPVLNALIRELLVSA